MWRAWAQVSERETKRDAIAAKQSQRVIFSEHLLRRDDREMAHEAVVASTTIERTDACFVVAHRSEARATLCSHEDKKKHGK